MEIRFAHTNLNAKDWRALSRFYQDVFGCVRVGPERDLYGDWFEKVTGIPGAHVEGEHIALPGYPENGPTLEIFTYNITDGQRPPYINGYGFAHIAFEVEDVDAIFERFKKHGGSSYGQRVSQFYPDVGKTLHIVYAKDPEGNAVEILKWE